MATKSNVTEINSAETQEFQQKSNDPWEMESLTLTLDKKNRQPLYVNVNNHNYRIPRGIEVRVPRFVAEVVRNSQRQDMETLRKIMALDNSL